MAIVKWQYFSLFHSTPFPTFPQGGAGASENSPVGYFSEQACLPRWLPCRQAPSLNQPTGLVLYARPSPWGKRERG